MLVTNISDNTWVGSRSDIYQTDLVIEPGETVSSYPAASIASSIVSGLLSGVAEPSDSLSAPGPYDTIYPKLEPINGAVTWTFNSTLNRWELKISDTVVAICNSLGLGVDSE